MLKRHWIVPSVHWIVKKKRRSFNCSRKYAQIGEIIMENKNVDVLIIGSGVSSLYSALNLNDNLDVLVVSKGKIDCTNTYLAQGGISVARNKEDIPDFIEENPL